MPTDPVRFESVTARDVSLIVLEELTCSAAFRSWLLEASGLEGETEPTTVLEARDSLGGTETVKFDADRKRAAIEAGLEIADERVLLVLTIDTALEADADADALESIRTRRDRALDGEWDDCQTVAVAPAAALETGTTGAESPMDATISLESLRDRFAARDTERGAFRASLLAAAIGDRGRTSDAPTIVDDYRAHLAEREPSVDLEAADASAQTDSATVAIDGPSLADDHRLLHSLREGTIELRIPGAAAHLQPFAARYATVLPPTTNFLTDGETLVLRLSVPSLASDSSEADSAADSGDDGRGSLEVDPSAVDEALSAVRDLLDLSARIAERGS
ncbi:hypothetical protein [Natronolimnohabitans innermongolicus]|uniref:Uncharacterized protein n=1 Tax=Natronolimnohabitans innermongolicus JCM 12255 TaxID=1227499 RepID=L9WQE2_9EURY|nr:hypothetical protein [Natronolimnohabitans innermongolicus]ELY51704.1 hypothetical protein C493_17281 [Natronolimnohabitans innermongolicus JCM 12255]